MPTTHEAITSEEHVTPSSPDSHGQADPPVPPDNHGRNEDEERVHRHKDDLLDQGVEETFPASDPVAVKHIT